MAWRRWMAGACGALALAGCADPVPGPGGGAAIGGGDPYPLTAYDCGGTRLEVRLMGDKASVSVNGAAPIELPAFGESGTTYTNGRQTLTIEQGKVSWGLGRAMPTACTEG